MDEHDDDLASEVIEGEEIEMDAFGVDEEQEIPEGEGEDAKEGEATTDEDESEL